MIFFSFKSKSLLFPLFISDHDFPVLTVFRLRPINQLEGFLSTGSQDHPFWFIFFTSPRPSFLPISSPSFTFRQPALPPSPGEIRPHPPFRSFLFLLILLLFFTEYLICSLIKRMYLVGPSPTNGPETSFHSASSPLLCPPLTNHLSAPLRIAWQLPHGSHLYPLP